MSARSTTELEGLLLEGLDPRPRSKTKRERVDEARLYGAELPPEIATLYRLNETFPLDRQAWGAPGTKKRARDHELRPLFFEESFGLAGREAAKAQLERAPQLGWPVYFEAHFWNAFPIGATHGGDYLLAQVEAPRGARRPVFLYDHETGELTREASSVEALVARARGKKRPPDAAGKSDPRFDPLALYRRSYWLTCWLAGGDPDDVSSELARAPAFTEFEEERPLFPKAPHLALYWIFAHAILGNPNALDQATADARGLKHAFVASARVLSKRLIDPTFTIGALTNARRRAIHDLLQDACPPRLLEPERRPQRAASKSAESNRVGRLATGKDPEALLEEHPDDRRAQLAALDALAKREKRRLAEAVAIVARFAKVGGSPGGSRWPKDWASLLADRRLRNILLILFREGQPHHFTAAKSSDYFIAPLARIGDPVVTEAFVDALTKPCHRGRRVELLKHLHTVRDPRVDEAFEVTLVWLEEEKYASEEDPLLEGYLRRYVEALAMRYTVLSDRARIERLVLAVLGATTKVSRETKKRMVKVAIELEIRRAAPALRKALTPWTKDTRPHYACQEDFYLLGGALARLAPEEAASFFRPVWDKFTTYGPLEELATNENLFAIGSAVLVPLLGSTAREEYLAIAEKLVAIARRKLAAPDPLREGWIRGIRHLVAGLDAGGKDLALDWLRRPPTAGCELDGEIRALAERFR